MEAEEQKASGQELAAQGAGWREDGEGGESFEEKEVRQNYGRTQGLFEKVMGLVFYLLTATLH